MVVVSNLARANNRILAGNEQALNTMNIENDLEMKKEVQERTSHRMAKVHPVL